MAAEIQSALDAIVMDGSEEAFRAVSTRLRAQVDLGLRILTTVATFAGELEGIGLAVWLKEVVGPTASET